MEPGFPSSCASITLGATYLSNHKAHHKHASFPPFQWNPEFTHGTLTSRVEGKAVVAHHKSRNKANLRHRAASKGSGAYPASPSLFARRGSVQAPPAFVFPPSAASPTWPPGTASTPNTPSTCGVSPAVATTTAATTPTVPRLQRKLLTKRSKSAHELRPKRKPISSSSSSSMAFPSIYGTRTRVSAGEASPASAALSSSWIRLCAASEEPWPRSTAQQPRRHSIGGGAPDAAIPPSPPEDDDPSVTSCCCSGSSDNHSGPSSPSTQGVLAGPFHNEQQAQSKATAGTRCGSRSRSSSSSTTSNDGESDPEHDSDADEEWHKPVSLLPSRRSSSVSARSPRRTAALCRSTRLVPLAETGEDQVGAQRPDSNQHRAAFAENSHATPCAVPAGKAIAPTDAQASDSGDSTSIRGGEKRCAASVTVLSTRVAPATLSSEQVSLLRSKEADVVFRFDDVPEDMRWEKAMKLRKQARQQYLHVRRGRRASRTKGKRVAGAAARSQAAAISGSSGGGGKLNSGRSSNNDSNSSSSSSSSSRTGSESEDAGDNGAIDTSCPYCSKSYRQNNSFFKHLYEHHPQWQYVAETFNMSKHQQVMMMQTAELLLSLRKPLNHGLQPLVRFDP